MPAATYEQLLAETLPCRIDTGEQYDAIRARFSELFSKNLLEESGRPPSDLLLIFGQRSHVNEALNGKRRIGAEQARKLGKMFSVKAGLFV